MAATVDITLVTVENRVITGATLPVEGSTEIDQDTIVASGSSQQSDFAAPGSGLTGAFWVITLTGGNIRAKFGSNPAAVAAEAGGRLMLAGTTRHVSALGGDKVAIIAAEV